MPRPRTVSDEQILAAARALFHRDGHTAKTRDIARAAGISQAVLYQRFRSKEQLFFRAMMPPPPDIDALLAPLDSVAPPASLRAVARALHAHFAATVPAILHLTTHPAFEVERLGDAHRHLLAVELHQRLAERIERLSKDGEVGPVDAPAAAGTLIALAHTAALHGGIGHPGQDGDGGAMLDGMVDLLWSGLAQPEATA